MLLIYNMYRRPHNHLQMTTSKCIINVLMFPTQKRNKIKIIQKTKTEQPTTTKIFFCNTLTTA